MKIDIELIKKLRAKTGAGVMDCKRALEKTNGDIDKAVEELRKMGLAKAEKKLERPTQEGIVEAYIHFGNRLGVLVELNCETDFAANTPEFKRLARDIAMQIAATDPKWISRDDVPKKRIEYELQIYKEQAKNEGKPEHTWDRIAQGKLEKFLKENCLLEQPFIKNPEITVETYIKEHIAKFSENIRVKRFARFKVGEEE